MGGVNDNGETWYITCDGAGNMLGISTGIDELSDLHNRLNQVDTADFPVEKQQRPNDYTIVWGGSVKGGVVFEYFYSEMVIVDTSGNYYDIQTKGGGVSTGAGFMFDSYEPGQTININNIDKLNTWGTDLSLSWDFLNLEVYASLTIDARGATLKAGENEIIFGLTDPGASLAITKTTVIKINEYEVNNHMLPWVRQEYRKRGYLP